MPGEKAAAEAAHSHLDALVRASKTPGIQYLVVSPDQTIFEYAGGWADIAGRRPMDFATTLMAYSMSKTITAAAVLQLVEAQKVNLDDPISRCVGPQVLDPRITIRHLLSHTSGLPNPIPLAWVHPVTRHEGFDERAALAAVLRRYMSTARRLAGWWVRPGASAGSSRTSFTRDRDCSMTRCGSCTTRPSGRHGERFSR
jgi:CubicO group peptidase (beta-lactamase class C family)